MAVCVCVSVSECLMGSLSQCKVVRDVAVDAQWPWLDDWARVYLLRPEEVGDTEGHRETLRDKMADDSPALPPLRRLILTTAAPIGLLSIAPCSPFAWCIFSYFFHCPVPSSTNHSLRSKYEYAPMSMWTGELLNGPLRDHEIRWIQLLSSRIKHEHVDRLLRTVHDKTMSELASGRN